MVCIGCEIEAASAFLFFPLLSLFPTLFPSSSLNAIAVLLNTQFTNPLVLSSYLRNVSGVDSGAVQRLCVAPLILIKCKISPHNYFGMCVPNRCCLQSSFLYYWSDNLVLRVDLRSTHIVLTIRTLRTRFQSTLTCLDCPVPLSLPSSLYYDHHFPPFFFNIIAILFSTDTTLALVLSPKHWDRYGVGSGMLYGHVLAPLLPRKWKIYCPLE